MVSSGEENGYNAVIDKEDGRRWSHTKRLDFYGQSKKLDNH